MASSRQLAAIMNKMKKAQFLFICIAIILVVSCRKNLQYESMVITSFSPAKGAWGNIVKISGKGFGNSISVLNLFFNGKEAVISTLADTSITTIVPQGVTTGKITVSLDGKVVESKTDFILLPGVWIRKKDLPFPDLTSYPGGAPGRLLASGFAIRNQGYAGAGHSPNKDGVGPFLKDWWEYDQPANQWIRKADIPLADGIWAGVYFGINNKGYIGIGRTERDFTNEFWQYDPITDHWTRKADFPGSWKKGSIGFGIDSKGYVGLGESWNSTGGFAQTDWWEYDPATDHWSRKADFPGPHEAFLTGFVLNNKIYLGLGGPTQQDRSWWEYDPVTNRWNRKSDYPGDKLGWWAPAGFAIANKGYVVGISECWKYEPALDLWTQQAFFDDYRISGVAFSIGSKGYFTTGGAHFTNYSLQNDLWEFTPPN